MIDEELAKDELIGLKVRVEASKNRDQEGLEGVVVDETRNMLVIQTVEGEKKIFKEQASFIFTLPDGKKIVLDGKKLLSRSEERIKKKWPKKRW